MPDLPPVVPFVRKLEFRDVGRDVIAVKRALSRAGYMQWGDFTTVWGEHAVTACKRFQQAKKIRANGEYGFSTHEHLRKTRRKGSRTEWAYDALSIKIMRDEDLSPYEVAVSKIVAAVDQAILRRDQIRYSQTRPFPDIAPYPNLPNIADCSGFVTWALRSGGCPDPNGTIGGTTWTWGFTGTLLEHNQIVTRLADCRLGDLVFYGRPWMAGGAAHVGIVRQITNGVVYVGHHGSNAGPLNSRADYRQVAAIRRPAIP